MKQQFIKLIFAFIFAFSLSLGNIATALGQAQVEAGVIHEEIPFADLQDHVDNPCTGGNITITDGTIQITRHEIEVVTPSGVEIENELQQLNGTALGEDEDGNIYAIKAQLKIDDECGISDVDPSFDSCVVIHVTFRSKTTSNFSATELVKLINGETVMSLVNLTCQSEGRTEL